MLDGKKRNELVDYVLNAQDENYEILKITEKLYPKLTMAEAYQIQAALIKRRLDRGEKIVGPKMGLTSLAKLQQMNVSDPIYGYVFDTMVVPDGGTAEMADYIHPKVEPEIGFILKKELKGPGVTKEAVLEATEAVFPAIEIIDSRYLNFNFTMTDVVADNTSAAGAVFGTHLISPKGIDLETIGVVLQINGEVKTVGAGAAVLNHPAESVAYLANMLAEKGEAIKPGEPILTGGLTEAVAVSSGDYVEVKFGETLGEVRLFMK
ncbi:2-keto-4-pentenoate hydratase [Enterococcus sp. LJL128]|uniref:2-keto-4-pentenoate hydratase n=1 Tax=Enterococcus sp. LJL51 TaxID=3416656 RepID=UPI003CF08BC0